MVFLVFLLTHTRALRNTSTQESSTLLCNTTQLSDSPSLNTFTVSYTRRRTYYIEVLQCVLFLHAHNKTLQSPTWDVSDQSSGPPPLNIHTLPEGVKETPLKSPYALSLSSCPQWLFVLQPLGHQHDNTSGPKGPVCVSVCVCVK